MTRFLDYINSLDPVDIPMKYWLFLSDRQQLDILWGRPAVPDLHPDLYPIAVSLSANKVTPSRLIKQGSTTLYEHLIAAGYLDFDFSCSRWRWNVQTEHGVHQLCFDL